jgi:hypothetical protein
MGVNLGFRLKKARGIEINFGRHAWVCVWIWTGPLALASWGEYVDPFDLGGLDALFDWG